MTEAETQALKQLADIALPPPVSWMPQTWGWAVLAVLAVILGVWAIVRWRRLREANRYRVEALNELERLQEITAIPPLVKRVALVTWQRKDVAALTGAQWVAFLRNGGEVDEALARLLDDAEYRRAQAINKPGNKDSFAQAKAAARRWIARHRNGNRHASA